MNKEYIIYIFESILIIFLLFRFIPKDKIREAHVAYLFKLVITWLVGLIVAEYRLIEYPVRMFPYATKANFLFEFFLYPSICTLFIVNYPEKKNIFSKFMYYFYYCSSLTIFEIFQERYTKVLTYIHWTWYITWITFFITFFLAQKYNKWFFSKVKIVKK
ncbi:CBO0543 family protein [Clostridium felsineum]|uniref:CBO0543 family protein n=1 Tax=Clostridium felsineum TaxID=36839 RepID=UPI00098C2968|nr:CBO0543 family protein [Clostridium felsineum]URZ14529.1 hypothetical protein CLFE_005260 [Clostridium felsineum DSM 794]